MAVHRAAHTAAFAVLTQIQPADAALSVLDSICQLFELLHMAIQLKRMLGVKQLTRLPCVFKMLFLYSEQCLRIKHLH